MAQIDMFHTALEIVENIKQGVISVRDVLDAHLNQIARHHGAINAVVTVDADKARQQAQEMDGVQRPEDKPLWGVPMTIKDGWQVRQMRSTAGYPPLADYIPENDAVIVARLREAGAIIVGKSNVPILSTDTQTHNEIFGRTNNPWNLERTPGGSSGGSAAAVASGMVPLDIGSDVAGSLRIPAHYCGIYSLKPTEHRVPMTGYIPPLPEAHQGIEFLSVAGPLARCIDDLTLALKVIAGPDESQPQVPPVPLVEVSAPPLEQLRIAWSGQFGHVPVTEDTRHALKTLAAKLEAQGCIVSAGLPEGFVFPDIWETFGELYWAMVGSAMEPDEDASIAYDAGFVSDSQDAFSRGAAHAVNGSIRLYSHAMFERKRYIRALDHFLTQWDVLICPVAATPAIPHIPHMSNVTVAGKQINYFERGTYYCIPFNLTGHPVVVIPAGYAADGLPIGVQIVGQRWGEMRLLAIAKQIDDVINAYRRPPGY